MFAANSLISDSTAPAIGNTRLFPVPVTNLFAAFRDPGHLGPRHRYWLAMHFAPESGGARLTWHMRFESAGEHERPKDFIITANEQNFDRLAACLSGTKAPVR